MNGMNEFLEIEYDEKDREFIFEVYTMERRRK